MYDMQSLHGPCTRSNNIIGIYQGHIKWSTYMWAQFRAHMYF